MINKHKKFKYKNLVVLFISIAIALALWQIESFHEFLLDLGMAGDLGAFIAGILFVWIFTMPTALLILLTLSQSGTLSPIEIGIIAGAGAVLGDLVIFKFVRDGLSSEIEELYQEYGPKHLQHVLNSKYFHWTLPIIGAIMIASPLPDELGVSLLGISKMRSYNFILLSFFLNSLGIYTIIALGQIF